MSSGISFCDSLFFTHFYDPLNRGQVYTYDTDIEVIHAFIRSTVSRRILTETHWTIAMKKSENESCRDCADNSENEHIFPLSTCAILSAFRWNMQKGGKFTLRSNEQGRSCVKCVFREGENTFFPLRFCFAALERGKIGEKNDCEYFSHRRRS